MFSHWASVNSRPYRAIDPPSALLTLLIAHFGRNNYCKITALYPVLKQLLVCFLVNITGKRWSIFER